MTLSANLVSPNQKEYPPQVFFLFVGFFFMWPQTISGGGKEEECNNLLATWKMAAIFVELEKKKKNNIKNEQFSITSKFPERKKVARASSSGFLTIIFFKGK